MTHFIVNFTLVTEISSLQATIRRDVSQLVLASDVESAKTVLEDYHVGNSDTEYTYSVENMVALPKLEESL